MAVSFDQASSTDGSGLSVTLSATVGSGSNQALVVWANISNSLLRDPDPIRATCDGAPMVVIVNADTGNQASVATYFRTVGFVTYGLSSGSHSIVVSQASGTAFFFALIAASFFGVQQIYAARQAQALFTPQSTSTPSLVIPCQPGDATCDAVSDFNFVPASPTQTSPTNGIKDGLGVSYALATGTSETHGWTFGGSTPCTQSGVALRAATNAIGYSGAIP